MAAQTTQPGGQVQWMSKPEGHSGCPPGLEYLTQIDQLLIHQQVDLFEVLTGWEVSNRYAVKNSVGQQVFFSAEESDVCMRQCCGNNRGFVMHITDNAGQEVIRLSREFKCWAGCGCFCCAGNDCCASEMTIEAPVGTIVGRVKQKKTGCCYPGFIVSDPEGTPIFNINGLGCCGMGCQNCFCTDDVEFNVYSADMQHEVGKISKQWAGCLRGCTDASNFGVSFPMDLDVKVKASMLGACFLIDYMFFEINNK